MVCIAFNVKFHDINSMQQLLPFPLPDRPLDRPVRASGGSRAFQSAVHQGFGGQRPPGKCGEPRRQRPLGI